MKPSKQPSFLVVGSGVIGLSLAFELAQRGLAVKVIESAQLASPSASWAGAGILPPPPTRNMVDPYDRLRALSHRLHPEWARRLHQLTNIDTGYRRCGGLYLATSRAESATLSANRYWWDEHGIEYQQLSSTQLVQLEPSLKVLANERLVGAWRLPDECQLRNPRHLRALRLACELHGVQFEIAPIESVLRNSDGTATLQDNQGKLHSAEQICLCTGAWTRMLLNQLSLPNGIMPIRGQMLLYKSTSPLLTHVVNEGHRYLVARDDGYLLAGSVEEEVGYVVETTDSALASIRSWAEQIVPELRSTKLEKSWAGLRPGSFDGLPYLGLAPGTHNLFVAAGHFRSGLHMSCATAVVMADLMTGQQPALDLTPFRIARG
jgi:glycine oxidase